ncbi:MAG: nucleotidyltransferase family protein [Gemmatimonadota bacterium]
MGNPRLTEAVAGGRAGALARVRPESWPALAREVRYEGLDGLVYALCLDQGIAVPQAEAAELAWGHREVAARNLAALSGLEELVAELERAGHEVAVLPGASLLHRYPDPGCRPMDDVDLLVPARQEAAVSGRLRSAGFSQSDRHEGIFQRGDLVVDLHVDLVNGARQPSRALASWMEPGAVWQRRRRLTSGRGGFWVLGIDDEVIYTAAHALRHSYRRLSWLCDLRLLLREEALDWDALRHRAAAFAAHRALAYGLRFLDEVAGAALPPPAAAYWRGVRCSALEECLVRALFRRGREAELGEVLWSYSCPGWVARARFLADFLFPRPPVLRQVYPRVPRGLLPLAYAMRAAEVVRRGSAALVSLAKG